jgi:hypothetical protein
MKDPAEGFDEEVELVVAVLKHPAGYDLDLFGGMLFIRSTDQETYECEWETGSMPKTDHKSFPQDQIKEAAIFFVKKRHEMALGVDYEAYEYQKNKEIE